MFVEGFFFVFGDFFFPPFFLKIMNSESKEAQQSACLNASQGTKLAAVHSDINVSEMCTE